MTDKQSKKKGFSRRDFLKGAAAMAAAGGLITAAPRVTKAAKVAKTTQMSVDICVIGGAGAGLTAAVSASEAGVKNIIVLEKMQSIGGATSQVGNMFAVESPVHKRLGIHDWTADEAFRFHMHQTSWYCDAKLVRNWITSSGDIVEWLEEKGVVFGSVNSFVHESLPKTCHHAKYGSIGSETLKAMSKILKEKGIEVRTDTRVRKLLTDGDGSVNGVLATCGDEDLRISAKAVIIGTGSISGNAELKARFYPGEDMSNVHIMAEDFPHTTGDGFIMAEEIGAASTHISTLWIGPHGHGWNEQTGDLVRRPILPKVNKFGYRFCDEGLYVSNPGWEHSVALDRQPDKVCYALMDESMLQFQKKDKRVYSNYALSGPRMRADEFGKRMKMGGGLGANEEVTPSMFEEKRADWLDTVDEDIREEAKMGRVKVADTWDEIAQYIGCDAETLKDTVSQYNRYCLNRYDGEFVKDPEYLLPLTTPPFYALKSHSGIDTCIGGIRTNHHLEVVNKRFYPIKGLYAAGVCVGNWLGIGYAWGGSEFSFTQYSGYTAGKNAANLVLNKPYKA